MTVASTDYHDYVFRDGELVGDFERMYRNSTDVPWHQDRTAYEVGADIDISIMRTRRYRTIRDVGCGLGYFTSRMFHELQSPTGGPPSVSGVDCSSTAIEDASARFPGIRFVVADLLSGTRDDRRTRCDLVVARDVLWYVYKKLDYFLSRILAMVNGSTGRGHIHITQSFPSGDQWVGQNIIGGPAQLLDHLDRIMTVRYSCVEQDSRWSGAKVIHVFGEAK